MGDSRTGKPGLPDSPIIFFDGVCGLCNFFVDFVCLRDHAALFRFAPLQGLTFQERQTGDGVVQPARSGRLDSIVLGEGEAAYSKSDAVIRILELLGGKWQLFSVLRLIPRSLRDAGYDLVARNRYRWFGKRETCRVPTADERERFLP